MFEYPAGNYMLKINNRNTRARCEICSKLTIKTPEQRLCSCSGSFIVNFEQISEVVLNFEQINVGWVGSKNASAHLSSAPSVIFQLFVFV